MKAQESISKTTSKLILNEPFYGHFFTGVLKAFSTDIDTMSLTMSGEQMIQFKINPDWWNSEVINEQQRYGAIKHQILHVVFKHVFQSREFGKRRLFSIAADIVVNQYIERAQLASDAILLDDFDEIELESNLDVRQYYNQLSDFLKTSEQENSDSPTYNYLKQLLEKDNDLLGEHQSWAEFEQLDGAERKLIEVMLDSTLENSFKRYEFLVNDRGTLPKEISERLKALIHSKQPKVNWRRAVRLFGESSSKTVLKNTLKRRSKRYGTSPGIKIRSRHKLLVAVDVSGSVNLKEINLLLNEVYHLWKSGAEVLVIEFDTDIQNVFPYKGKTPKFITGRGGTDFSIPIEYGNSTFFPDGLIFLTDGKAPVSNLKARFPIFWAITPDGESPNSEFWKNAPGRKVKLNPD